MKFNKQIFIDKYLLSNNSKVFIIAEAGVNHNGSLETAKRLIDVAKESEVDAIKFQAFKTNQLILDNVEKAPYQKRTLSDESQFEMLQKLEFSQEQNIELMRYCQKKDLIFLTTPFDEESLSALDELDLPAYKVSSTDLTNMPFLQNIAQKNKPIMLSTGMSYLSEVEMALKMIHPFNQNVILLQCSTNYPLRDDEVHLEVMNTFKKNFDILIGYSDHSFGIGAAPYAVAMGAKVIEKHFTLDKNMPGPDHKASLSPEELIQLVKEIRKVERYLGDSLKIPTLAEIQNRKAMQKNLVAAIDIEKGELFSVENTASKRTGGIGISPLYYEEVLGKTARKKFKKNDIIDL